MYYEQNRLDPISIDGCRRNHFRSRINSTNSFNIERILIMEEAQNPNWHGRLWRFVPLILWIFVIFYSSTANASMGQTSRFLRPLLETLFSSEETIYWANVIVRKIAHISFYGFLALLAFYAFIGSPFDRLKRNWFWSVFGLVLIIATIDEIHQSFVPSRAGSPMDVLLDCIGGLIVLLIIRFFNIIRTAKR